MLLKLKSKQQKTNWKVYMNKKKILNKRKINLKKVQITKKHKKSKMKF